MLNMPLGHNLAPKNAYLNLKLLFSKNFVKFNRSTPKVKIYNFFLQTYNFLR